MIAAVGRPIVLLVVRLLVGLLFGFLANQLLKQIVYQANPVHPAVLTATVLTVTLLGIASSAIPARQALAVDPSKLIHEE